MYANRMMKIAAPLVLCLAAAACGGRSERGGETPVQPASAVEPATNMATASKGSIMRPSVVNESAPAPAPEPAPEPLRAQIFFDPGEAALTDAAEAALGNVLKAAASNPSATLVVRGYSDSKGDPADNLLMSAKRANAAREYLVEHGVAQARIKTAALGEAPSAQKPAPGSGEEDGNRSRRVDILVGAPSPAAGTVPADDR
jgi:outer membrane protein OmpA-like peptidoglycan-associated protein